MATKNTLDDTIIERRMNAIDALIETFLREKGVTIEDVELVERATNDNGVVEHAWYIRLRPLEMDAPQPGTAVFGIVANLADKGVIGKEDIPRALKYTSDFMEANNIPIPAEGWESEIKGAQ